MLQYTVAVEDVLRHVVGPFQTDWDPRLAAAEFALKNAWNSIASVRNTPCMLIYGQHPYAPAMLIVQTRNK
jgi:hypothetical protein